MSNNLRESFGDFYSVLSNYILGLHCHIDDEKAAIEITTINEDYLDRPFV